MECCGSAEKPEREWRPLEERCCTDILWLIIFLLFCFGMMFICGFAIASGAASRLVSGYDSFGNTCGQRNSPIAGIPLSGRDQTQYKYVFVLEPCNIDTEYRKIKSMVLCVSKCPDVPLVSYGSLQNFALQNGSLLCSYDLLPDQYTTSPEKATKCPKLPVPKSSSLPIFHRCAPIHIACHLKFSEALITFIGHDSTQHGLLAGVMTSKEIIVGLCLLALVLSFILMFVIRYISAVLAWIFTGVVILGSLGGTGGLWWLYADHRKALSTTMASNELQVAQDNVHALLIYAIIATVFTVVLPLLVFIMRKRVALTIALFHVAGKVFIRLPLLAIQPVWTFLALMCFWVYWVMVLLFLGTAGNPVKNNQTGFVEFHMSGPLMITTFYHFVGVIWISRFILACQQMTVAGAVVTYYFTRDKSKMHGTPILTSVFRLVRYHLGTVAKGSFTITQVKIPHLIAMYIHNRLKGKENAVARCLQKICIFCLWCLEKCLSYVNQNAYTATAINSTSYSTSARDALLILVDNALRVAAISTVGEFILFMGKILVVSCTAFVGVLTLNYQREYTVWVVPLIIVCGLAFLVADCILSIFENVVDVLFLCFAIDTKHNDGSPGREFYMDKALMEFVKSSRKAQAVPSRSDGTDGREMRPMASGQSSA
ncbi:choline transporter-like protein 1 isoform X2 [Brienomyrus brachyistius]|uniref:choline transporter-like protein 1 isoform X2 n=1 Tax=Brienomyrus brachyistius TaxID=42636 RepID=UPI0020B397C8|nr:choline transporter-like protein 1 isoform X2 [Brienomyrus brachyistius]